MLSFDELNLLKSQVEMGVMPTEALEDEFEEMLIDLYLMGFADVQKLVETEPNAKDLREAVFRKFDGKDFRDRLREHSGNVPDTLRVLDTDANRVYQAGQYDAAKRSGEKLFKTWRTMEDPKVRDTHDYLEGMKVPVEDDFYTYDGDHAPYPGAFEMASNNVNCRCGIDITKD